MPTDHDSIVEALRAFGLTKAHEWERAGLGRVPMWALRAWPHEMTFGESVESLVAENARLRGLVNQIHPLAEGLAIRCEILESVRDRRLSLVTTEDLAKHAGDTSASIYAALDRILADTNALKGDD
jgi:hypothetical protein